MKPHCMFFDEMYSEHYYRKDSMNRFMDEADCMIIVGTALATTMAKVYTARMLNNETCPPVIEVNMESSINRGHNI